MFFLSFRDMRGTFRLAFVPHHTGHVVSDTSASRILMCHPCMVHEPESHWKCPQRGKKRKTGAPEHWRISCMIPI